VRGVGVDRDEEVGLRLAGDHVALLERNEHVAVADQEGAHAGIGVDLRSQFARHRQRDFLLVLLGRADRARILAAVAGIDGDDQLAVTRADDVLQRACGRGLAGDRRALGAQLEHEARTVADALDAAARLHRTREIEHHAQVAFGRLAGAHAGDHAVRGRRLVARTQRSARQVEHQAVRVVERENLVVDGARQVDHRVRAGLVLDHLHGVQAGCLRAQRSQAQEGRNEQGKGGNSAHGRDSTTVPGEKQENPF